MKYFPICLLFIYLFYSCKTKTDAILSSPSSLENSVDSLVHTFIDSTKAAGAVVAVFKKNEKVYELDFKIDDLKKLYDYKKRWTEKFSKNLFVPGLRIL